jgi:hypothetical protein
MGLSGRIVFKEEDGCMSPKAAKFKPLKRSIHEIKKKGGLKSPLFEILFPVTTALAVNTVKVSNICIHRYQA